jgi:hypothetical protein
MGSFCEYVFLVSVSIWHPTRQLANVEWGLKRRNAEKSKRRNQDTKKGAEWVRRAEPGINLAFGGFGLAFQRAIIFRNAFVYNVLWIFRWFRFVK